MKQVLKVRCPNCRVLCQWPDNLFRPFCSQQCKARDLGNWADERYKIPVELETLAGEQGELPPVVNQVL